MQGATIREFFLGNAQPRSERPHVFAECFPNLKARFSKLCLALHSMDAEGCPLEHRSNDEYGSTEYE
jgi:hypothetical protein